MVESVTFTGVSTPVQRIIAHTISIADMEEPVGVHSIDMGRALYVWCGIGAPKLSELVVSAPAVSSSSGVLNHVQPHSSSSSTSSTSSSTSSPNTHTPTGPSSSILLLSNGIADRDEEEAFGRVLSKKFNKMVYLSWNIPEILSVEARVEIQKAVLVHLASTGALTTGTGATTTTSTTTTPTTTTSSNAAATTVVA